MTSELTEVAQVLENDTLKVFLSYSHSDRVIAAALKRILEANGMDVFLAHEDIEPCAKWIKTIIGSLDRCHVFIPLLTQEFEKSTWTNQELGYSLAKGKLIIPVKITNDPFGFINDIQALKLNSMNTPHPSHPFLGRIEYNYPSCASAIVEIVNSDMILKRLLKNGLVERLSISENFAETRTILWGLSEYDDFSKNQVDRIVDASIANRQVHNEMYTAQPFLKKLIVRYTHVIDLEKRETLERLMK